MKQMDEEYPDILPNRFKYRYVGTDTYLYVINRNLECETVDEEPEPVDEEEEEKETLYRQQLGDLMLKKLRGRQRTIVYKKFWEEKSLAQIGREMKMSRRLVYYHLKKAMKRLREYYEV